MDLNHVPLDTWYIDMEYMESRMQQQWDAANDKIESLEPFIEDLLEIIKKHEVDFDDIQFVLSYMKSTM